MTLDIYAGLIADDLDTVADQLDRAFAKLNLDPWIGSGSPGGLDVEVPFRTEESGVLKS